MKSQTKIRCRKVRGILCYRGPNMILYPKNMQIICFFFYLFRDEMDLFLGCPTLYQNKHLETGVQTAVNSNKIKFEPYGDLVNEAYSHCNANMLDKQDPFGQIENGKRGEAMYSNDQDDEKRTESIESGKTEQGTKRRVEKEQKRKQNR